MLGAAVSEGQADRAWAARLPAAEVAREAELYGLGRVADNPGIGF